MDDVTFDRLTRLIGSSQPRRGAMRAALGLVFGGAVMSRNPNALAGARHEESAEEAFAGGRGALDDLGGRSGARRRRSRDRDQRKRNQSGQDKDNAKGKEKKSCAEFGQKRKRGRPCCKGLVKNSSGFCVQPASPSCAASCTGCCDGSECVTDGSGDRCGANGEVCTQCPCGPGEIRCGGVCAAGDCCFGNQHQTCAAEETCCGLDGCQNLETDVNRCGDCEFACDLDVADRCTSDGCKCGTSEPCTGFETCVNGECRCISPLLECDGVCQTCAPPGIDTQSLAVGATSVQASTVSCCTNPDTSQEFCSCGGECCEGRCFWTQTLDGRIVDEFCCTGPDLVYCESSDPLNKGEVCCACTNGSCPSCEACLDPAASPGRIGAIRRPGR